MSSKAKRTRLKLEREHVMNPEIRRQQWSRKPMTQIVKNKKAEQRRSICRKQWHDDGAVRLYKDRMHTHGTAVYTEYNLVKLI